MYGVTITRWQTSVLAREPNHHQRCLLESWFIQKEQTLNQESGTGVIASGIQQPVLIVLWCFYTCLVSGFDVFLPVLIVFCICRYSLHSTISYTYGYLDMIFHFSLFNIFLHSSVLISHCCVSLCTFATDEDHRSDI